MIKVKSYERLLSYTKWHDILLLSRPKGQTNFRPHFVLLFIFIANSVNQCYSADRYRMVEDPIASLARLVMLALELQWKT